MWILFLYALEVSRGRGRNKKTQTGVINDAKNSSYCYHLDSIIFCPYAYVVPACITDRSIYRRDHAYLIVSQAVTNKGNADVSNVARGHMPNKHNLILEAFRNTKSQKR